MDVDGPAADVVGVSSIRCSRAGGAVKVVGELGEVGDAFEADILSVEVAFNLDAFLDALGLGTAGRLFSVSLISPSSRLSSVSEAVSFAGGVAFWSIADGGAVVDEDSSSP
jgi:hypothetical protein